jgi:hypothetical protein
MKQAFILGAAASSASSGAGVALAQAVNNIPIITNTLITANNFFFISSSPRGGFIFNEQRLNLNPPASLTSFLASHDPNLGISPLSSRYPKMATMPMVIVPLSKGTDVNDEILP